MCPMVFPGGSDSKKKSACNSRHLVLIPGLGRSLGDRNGNPLQYSCLGNPKDREAWWATVHVVTKSQTGLSNKALMHTWVLYVSGIKSIKIYSLFLILSWFPRGTLFFLYNLFLCS